jgi:ABC-2 type transport system permease protein
MTAVAFRLPGVVVMRQALRRAVRSGAVWGLVFGLYVMAQTLSYTSVYKTVRQRDQMALAYGSNIGLNALIGPARDINTVNGYACWRLLGILSILGGIWGVLTATRLLRGEEESGRTELLLAGQTTRRGAVVQAMTGLGGGLALLFCLTLAGVVLTGRSPSVGFSLPACLYFSVTLVASAAEFLAVGALTSQLAVTRRQAATLAGTVFGVSYALRMVADSDPSLHWLVWLSPLGWIEESRPLTDPHPAALLPVLALVALVVYAAIHLSGLCDLGSAVFPARDSATPRLALLGGPIRLAVRLSRASAAGWLFAVAAFAVLIGSVAENSTKDVSGSADISQAIGRVGGHGSLAAIYLGLTFLVLALITSMVAAGQAAVIRTEEADGHLENLVVRPLCRTAWFTGRLGLSAVLIVVAALVAGFGAWAGSAGQHTGVSTGSLLLAGLNIAPASLLILGLGALAFGVRPRWTPVVVYGYLAWSFLVELLGSIVHASHWLMDTSVFFHMAPAPASDPDWASAGVVTGIAFACAVAGCAAFNRRDLAGG